MSESPETVPDFESALKRLEEIVKKLESGDLTLDSALELFEEGIQLSRLCHAKLGEAERRVEILLKNNDGERQAVPFDTENETEVLAFFDRIRPSIDASLDELLPSESTPPAQIHRAMRYSIFAGGKRLRPALCVAGFSIYHSDASAILPVASALELAHTYSLIHDDLPAMDNDDFRRGRPSCHKQFGEATAILAGDALLTLAFETVASCRGFQAAEQLHATAALARALGTRDGMIAGQVLDLEAEGQPLRPGQVEAIHSAKTGALLSTSVWIGAYLGGADESDAAKILAYGRKIGFAFQIMDDVLDETESGETLGKTPGKDREHRKATYPAAFGLDESRQMVRRLTGEACQFVDSLGPPAAPLIEIARYLETRCR